RAAVVVLRVASAPLILPGLLAPFAAGRTARRRRRDLSRSFLFAAGLARESRVSALLPSRIDGGPVWSARLHPRRNHPCHALPVATANARRIFRGTRWAGGKSTTTISPMKAASRGIRCNVPGADSHHRRSRAQDRNTNRAAASAG